MGKRRLILDHEIVKDKIDEFLDDDDDSQETPQSVMMLPTAFTGFMPEATEEYKPLGIPLSDLPSKSMDIKPSRKIKTKTVKDKSIQTHEFYERNRLIGSMNRQSLTRPREANKVSQELLASRRQMTSAAEQTKPLFSRELDRRVPDRRMNEEKLISQTIDKDALVGVIPSQSIETTSINTNTNTNTDTPTPTLTAIPSQLIETRSINTNTNTNTDTPTPTLTAIPSQSIETTSINTNTPSPTPSPIPSQSLTSQIIPENTPPNKIISQSIDKSTSTNALEDANTQTLIDITRPMEDFNSSMQRMSKEVVEIASIYDSFNDIHETISKGSASKSKPSLGRNIKHFTPIKLTNYLYPEDKAKEIVTLLRDKLYDYKKAYEGLVMTGSRVTDSIDRFYEVQDQIGGGLETNIDDISELITTYNFINNCGQRLKKTLTTKKWINNDYEINKVKQTKESLLPEIDIANFLRLNLTNPSNTDIDTLDTSTLINDINTKKPLLNDRLSMLQDTKIHIQKYTILNIEPTDLELRHKDDIDLSMRLEMRIEEKVRQRNEDLRDSLLMTENEYRSILDPLVDPKTSYETMYDTFTKKLLRLDEVTKQINSIAIVYSKCKKYISLVTDIRQQLSKALKDQINEEYSYKNSINKIKDSIKQILSVNEWGPDYLPEDIIRSLIDWLENQPIIDTNKLEKALSRGPLVYKRIKDENKNSLLSKQYVSILKPALEMILKSNTYKNEVYSLTNGKPINEIKNTARKLGKEYEEIKGIDKAKTFSKYYRKLLRSRQLTDDGVSINTEAVSNETQLQAILDNITLIKRRLSKLANEDTLILVDSILNNGVQVGSGYPTSIDQTKYLVTSDSIKTTISEIKTLETEINESIVTVYVLYLAIEDTSLRLVRKTITYNRHLTQTDIQNYKKNLSKYSNHILRTRLTEIIQRIEGIVKDPLVLDIQNSRCMRDLILLPRFLE